MTITTSRRIGALALLATIAFGACSNGGCVHCPEHGPDDAPAPPRPRRRPAGPPRRPRPSPARSTSRARRRSSPSRRPSPSWSRRRTPASTSRSTGPGTGDGFKTFCKGETDISDASRKIKDEEAATCAAAGIEYTELKIAYDGMTVMTSPDNAAVDLPLVRRPVRADRPAVAGLRQVVVGDRPSPSRSARTRSSRTPTCRSPAPARSPARTTATSSWSSRRSPSKQTPPSRVRHPPRLRRERQRQRDHRRRRGLAELARLGRLRLRPGEQGQDQGTRRRQGAERHLRRSRPTRRSPTAPTRSRGACTSTSTRPRRRPTRPSPATSTSTSPTARSRRSSRRSRTSTCRPTSSPPRGPPGKPASSLLLLEPAGPARKVRPVPPSTRP